MHPDLPIYSLTAALHTCGEVILNAITAWQVAGCLMRRTQSLAAGTCGAFHCMLARPLDRQRACYSSLCCTAFLRIAFAIPQLAVVLPCQLLVCQQRLCPANHCGI